MGFITVSTKDADYEIHFVPFSLNPLKPLQKIIPDFDLEGTGKRIEQEVEEHSSNADLIVAALGEASSDHAADSSLGLEFYPHLIPEQLQDSLFQGNSRHLVTNLARGQKVISLDPITDASWIMALTRATESRGKNTLKAAAIGLPVGVGGNLLLFRKKLAEAVRTLRTREGPIDILTLQRQVTTTNPKKRAARLDELRKKLEAERAARRSEQLRPTRRTVLKFLGGAALSSALGPLLTGAGYYKATSRGDAPGTFFREILYLPGNVNESSLQRASLSLAEGELEGKEHYAWTFPNAYVALGLRELARSSASKLGRKPRIMVITGDTHVGLRHMLEDPEKAEKVVKNWAEKEGLDYYVSHTVNSGYAIGYDRSKKDPDLLKNFVTTRFEHPALKFIPARSRPTAPPNVYPERLLDAASNMWEQSQAPLHELKRAIYPQARRLMRDR